MLEKYGYPAARYKHGQPSRLVLTEEEDEQAFADGWTDHPNKTVAPEPKRGPGRPPKVANATSTASLDNSTTK